MLRIVHQVYDKTRLPKLISGNRILIGEPVIRAEEVIRRNRGSRRNRRSLVIVEKTRYSRYSIVREYTLNKCGAMSQLIREEGLEEAPW